jgi:FkbM family methyltransferase
MTAQQPGPPAAGTGEPDQASFDRDSYIRSPVAIAEELHGLIGSLVDPTIFDIGACEGEDSIRYARLFPTAHVYAVEPVPANVERCRVAVERYGVANIEILPYALADQPGSRVMYVSSGRPPVSDGTEDWDFGNKSSSLLEPGLHLSIHPWVTFSDRIEVKVRRLDEVCEALGIARIDFIHLDVQGAELLVLQGAGRFLAGPMAIWMEVEAVPLYAGQPLAPEVDAFMRLHGFEKRIDTVGSVSGDQLWVRAGS